MKVALVFPRFKYPCGDPPLGVAYIASTLKKFTKADVNIIDTTFMKGNKIDIMNEITAHRYDLVGISAMSNMIEDAFQVAKEFKTKYPSTKIVIGGPHATILPDETIKNKYVDAICIGEGELLFKDLVLNNCDFEKTHGIWYKNINNNIIKKERRTPIDNLNDLPFPAFELLPIKKYMEFWFALDSINPKLKGVNIISSRGCPYNCSYCQPTLFNIFGKKIRKRSPKNIVNEMIYWKEKYNIDGIFFQDDTLIFDRKWVNDICEIMIKNKVNIVWGCNARVNLIDRDLFVKMKQAGLRKVNIGIESGSQRILDKIYNKQITINQVKKAVNILKSLGLKIQGYFMIGAPSESEKEIDATINFAKNLSIDEATFSITTPLPGTYLYEKTKNDIIGKVESLDYYKKSLYNNKITLGNKKLNRLKKKAMIKFYLSTKHIHYTIKSFLSFAAIKKSIAKLNRF